ncbi:MAG: hypothetical protein A2W98_03385 [Bacteroidetes bacterium GWF2_33_38]|nr:MAG: hypothetical protein A2W98_03385 [Bacteroidetes bacterium GWF2_33_38]OFY85795.1 MAG: hypothetical protein A2236_06010 [Bacteroidetes bacterium RIFOXYA2_FULL_33_7]
MTIADAQNIAITDNDSYTANSKAMLDVNSETKGMLVPRVTTLARLAILTPPTSLLVFDTNLNQFMYYNGTTWVNLITSETDTLWSAGLGNIYLSNTLLNMGVGSTDPKGKLEVKADITNGLDEPIFDVVNHNGDTIFAVYPNGVRIYVYDDTLYRASSTKGGFAVGGFSPSRGTTTEYLRVTPDSIRMYIEEENPLRAESTKGGFAVGGFSPGRASTYNLFTINEDSAQVFIGDSTAGFGIANLEGGSSSLLNLTANNYFIGHNSGDSTKGGYFNSFYGYQAGKSNKTGSSNLFLGFNSGYSNVNGNRNVFLGKGAGYSNRSGFDNVFIGNGTGESNLSGWDNVFIGNGAGSLNNAHQNIFMGVGAGHANITGYQNIFIGYKSGNSNIGGTMEEGSVNTFIGMESGYSNTTGLANTFLGHKSGWSNIAGKFNTYLGRYAGETATGDFNVFLGSEAGRFQTGSYRLCINATQNGFYEAPLIYGEFDNNRVVINGDNTNGKTFFVNGSAGGTTTWAVISDRNYKKDIVEISNPLDKVMKLRGVNFNWKDNTMGDRLQMGFIAQEAEEVIPEVVDKFEGKYTMSYAPITALLVEAMKEQQKQIDALKNENMKLKTQIQKVDELNKKVDELIIQFETKSK